MMNDTNLIKLAEEAIITLQNENSSLIKELKHFKESQKLAIQLCKEGSITLDNLDTIIEKFASTSSDDLEITKRAYALMKTADFNLFSLSNEDTINITDAATLFEQTLLSVD